MPKKKTLVLWLDAFRKDYLNNQDTPFLYSLTREFNIGDLKPVLGYTSIGASFFTGVYPNKHDQFTIYVYGGKTIKNRLLKCLPAPMDLYYLNLSRYFVGNDFFVPLIPHKYLSKFTISQNKFYHHEDALKVNTFFGLLRKNKLRFIGYNYPLIATNNGSKLTILTKSNDKERTNRFLKLCKKQYDFYFLHLWDLDKYGHILGPDSSALKRKIREQDELTRKIINNFDLENDNIILWSDHGMLEVNGTVNLVSKLPKCGDDYIYFLDSTMARCWFSNEKIRQEVIAIFNEIKGGHLLSEREKKIFHIDFLHNKYGDEIFLLDPGKLLIPNFFQRLPVKGMHGYDLSNNDEHGFFFINRKTKNHCEVIDLFPTILEMMRIRIDYPIDGKSILI